MSSIFTNGLRLLEPDLFSIIIPFVLIFTLTFATLLKAGIFAKKSHNVVIALCLALIVIAPHVFHPGGPQDIIAPAMNAIAQVGYVLVAILLLMVVLGIFGAKMVLGEQGSMYLTFAAFLIVVGIFVNSLNPYMFGFNIYNFLSPSTVQIIFAILLFGLIVWFITRETTPANQPNAFTQILDDFKKSFKN